ncbi:zinc finger CCCH domain-containing protein 7A [Paramormyrops kingsleyae]|uniref:Zinc finger CCCH-type containing 7A n=1 Tax=Paramormyrops kingsleyae TaxID=1676925 RepID=A0A3B3QLW8_9TELE|nr:zinc finger CCCH domain-containing protein 7A isoform X2 [Paramormyrops kingsleyae]XP_023654261.1 zinc finger CCCH domain-containing protein 7A isoform X2 [Paramormyrops kingsleyae]XP_023654262.1 zinc finger CCCH domain-containing protein 7A isoform X2 [Paramormyrops kingsleyae]XP_023654263.1 zinc finger CCCH domain-containing protein 7A isoform X2 [Paramormyrops kingsleyae]
MSSAPKDRKSRWQDIQKGLEFIESTLPFPGPDEQYNEFIQNLVTNLFEEGNDVYSEGERMKSVEHYTEALSVADYAASEDIVIHSETLEKLYANRAAAYLCTGVYDPALSDCEEALKLNSDNHRALYRKARCLKEMGRNAEAYEAISKCFLAVPQDPSVIKLTEDLAKFLGLKVRKPYTRRKPASNMLPDSSNSAAPSEKSFKEVDSVEDIELVSQAPQQMGAPLLAPSMLPQPPLNKKGSSETASVSAFEAHNVVLVANGGVARSGAGGGARGVMSYPLAQSPYNAHIIGNELDKLLDVAAPGHAPGDVVARGSPMSAAPDPLLTSSHHSLPYTSSSIHSANFTGLYTSSGSSGNPEFDLASFPSALDSLDSLPIPDMHTVTPTPLEMGGALLPPGILAQPPVSHKGGNEAASLSLSPFKSHNAAPLNIMLPLLANGGGARGAMSFPMPPSHLDSFGTQIIGDELDKLLEVTAPGQAAADVVARGSPPITAPDPLLTSSHHGLPYTSSSVHSANYTGLYTNSGSSGNSEFDLVSFSSTLDTLDNLCISESEMGTLDFGMGFPPMYSSETSLDPQFRMTFNVVDGQPSIQVPLPRNPLSETHEFRQACSCCYVKLGPGMLDYSLSNEAHKCKKDVLLGRLKNFEDQRWKRIRPRPTKNQYVGPYYVCKDVAGGEECKYPGHCTFAYCQEEIDVWTLERKGFITRDILVNPQDASKSINFTVSKILQEHQGMFIFLCEDCFDNKPRIISRTSKDNRALCSHPTKKHVFKDRRCLVHVAGEGPQVPARQENRVSYSKIRPYSPLSQRDLCRHVARYGCVREDSCFFAHSLVELKVWIMQGQRGMSSEDIVQESSKCWNLESSVQQSSSTPKFGPAHLKISFVCSQCWRNGQVIEADKNRKYCAAKARHPWAKDKRVLLVSSVERKKWLQIRPLPVKKPIPSQFEICLHISSGKKCQYIGVCTFAHSPEERDLWTFMKESNIADFERLYELWLRAQKPGGGEEASSQGARENGRHIHMPTDYAEEVARNHCWLCGKNCNSDRQWQQHITSEKHKEKVFNSEDDQNCWQYRFPTGTFRVCERYLRAACPDKEKCEFAHGKEELEEWKDRRDFLLRKLAKAKMDHLIAPDDNDFGKYSFMLKEIN